MAHLLGQSTMYWRFASHLRKFLSRTLTLDECNRIIRRRLENRPQNLLAIVRGAVYENAKSPYLKLLRASGCEYGDFERMVTANGVENTLEELREAGVYVTIEEFKGKKECERHGKTYSFTERDFDNPIVSGLVPLGSSGSRSKGTRSLYDLDFLASNWALYNLPLLQGLDASNLPIAMWMPTIPGAGLINLLAYTKGGNTPARWFSPVDSQSLKASLKSRLAHSYILSMGRLAGVRWPLPEYIPYDDAVRVAEWIADTTASSGGCVLDTYVSAILRVCRAARETGIDIDGARFISGGEPLTEAKLKIIESAGAHACIGYAISEAGFVGATCFDPSHTDDMHLFEDSFALIQHRRRLLHVDVDVDAFLLTSLDPSAPKVLLNMETGDYGQVETRSCDCVFGSCGLHRHIHDVRGFDRLTSEGMSFFGADLVRIIEEVLPHHFGGSPTDYQMVEEEDEHGTTRLYISASPELGDIDEQRLVQTVLAELAAGTEGMELMAKVWSEAKTVEVRRTRPVTTVTGKLLPLHIQKTRH